MQTFNDMPLISCLKKFVENTNAIDLERKQYVEKICTTYYFLFFITNLN